MYYAFQCRKCLAAWTYETAFTTCPTKGCGTSCTGKLVVDGDEDLTPKPFAKLPIFEKSYDTVTGCKYKPLRVMSWNIERLGGDGSLGVPARRDDAVIAAIAKVITTAEPDICCLIEVMEANGATEMGRIGDALGSDWEWHMPSNGFRVSEAYGLILRKAAGITCTSFQLVVKDFDDDDLYFPTVNHRPPAEALLKMPGSWTLPVLIFHAPGPKAQVKRQREIESAIANLGKVGSIRTAEDALICADLNANEEGLNLVEEAESYIEDEFNPDIVNDFVHSLIEASTAKNAIELKVSELTQEIEKKAEEISKKLDDELSKVADPLKKIKKKDRDLWEKTWIPRLFHSPAPHKQKNSELLSGTDLEDLQLFEEFKKTFPDMSLEDARLALEAARKLKGTIKDEVAKFKRAVKQTLKDRANLERIENREAAWAPLILLGFQEDLAYDNTLLTTRRKNMWTALVSRGLDEEDKQEYVFLPDDIDSFSASFYDQILPLSKLRLRNTQVVVISLFAAVASPGEWKTVYGEDCDQFLPDDVKQDEDIKDVGASPFRMEKTLFHEPVGLAHEAMKPINFYARAKKKVETVMEGENKELKAFVVAQAVLMRAKAISDHDPLLLAAWVRGL